MKFEDLLKEWYPCREPTIVTLTIATSGLKLQEHDKIIGFATTENEVLNVELNKTFGSELFKAQAFHKISEDIMRDISIEEADFKKALDNVLKKDIVLTYNVPFFEAFINDLYQDEDKEFSLYDITVIYKALLNKYAFDNEQLYSFNDFYNACLSSFTPITIPRLCQMMRFDRNPSPGQLPMERMQQLLTEVFSVISSTDIQRFQR